jgi:hypothetical protein
LVESLRQRRRMLFGELDQIAAAAGVQKLRVRIGHQARQLTHDGVVLSLGW